MSVLTSLDEPSTGRFRGRAAHPAGAAARAGAPDGPRRADPPSPRLAGPATLPVAGADADPLRPLLGDLAVTDVFVNGPHEVWVDRGDGPVRTALSFGSGDRLRRYAQRLASAGGRRLDDGSPYVDLRLPDGTRLHAVLPPLAVAGPYLSLRTFRPRAFTLAELVEAGTLSPEAAVLLDAVVAARLAYLVTGGTGSGKTTLLATLLGRVAPAERIVVVEDATELRPHHPHVVALQARTANVEGVGNVGMRELVRQALRMRPDRLVVGECRGAEVVDFLGALNTGHDGGAGTLHANTPADVPARLEALGLCGDIPRNAIHAQAAAALQVVVHLRRAARGRVLEQVCLLVPEGPGGFVVAVPAWHRATGAAIGADALGRLLAGRGVAIPAALLNRGGAA